MRQNLTYLRRLSLLVLLSALLFPLSAFSEDVPFLGGRVNDYAGILSSSTITELDRTLKAFEDSTSNQVVVLTINSLNGESLEEYSVNVAQTWKLGQKGKDNGVLLLVVKDDRKLRIEVGYGLEGSLTDAVCSVIIQREILPKFKKGNYNAGVKAGVASIMSAINGTFTAEHAAGTQHMEFPEILIFLGIFTVVVGLFTFIALFTKGFMGWFLYVFLIPFWMAFPYAAIGGMIGLLPFAIYFIGFPIAKLWLAKSTTGIHWQTVLGASILAASSRGGFGSSGGGWSSGGGGFSGGGGSFGGGGSSGSW
ncbi:MAG TPA: TPM domain-containing protein [Bacteroidota bacterium]